MATRAREEYGAQFRAGHEWFDLCAWCGKLYPVPNADARTSPSCPACRTVKANRQRVACRCCGRAFQTTPQRSRLCGGCHSRAGRDWLPGTD